MSTVAPARSPAQLRRGTTAAVLAEIYEPAVSLAVWQAGMAAAVAMQAHSLARAAPDLKIARSGTPASLRDDLCDLLQRDQPRSDLIAHLHHSLILCWELFEPKALGLRLESPRRAMCPRFHVDWLPARMITTLCGPGTEWLPEHAADRSWLGPAGAGKTDDTSGVIREPSAIRQLHAGDLALMKGEGWEGNTGRGLIHRSPSLPPGQHRLVMTVDLMDA